MLTPGPPGLPGSPDHLDHSDQSNHSDHPDWSKIYQEDNQRIRIFNTWSSCVSLPLVNSNTMFTYISSLAWVLTAQSFHDEYGQRCQVYGLVSTTITSIMFIIAFLYEE